MTKERVIAYVDGYNVYYGMKRKGWEHLMWLDYFAMLDSVTRSDQALVDVHYFTALSNKHESQRRQQNYLNALEANGRLAIHLGRIETRRVRCDDDACSAKWSRFQEKESDVRLALQVMADAMDNRMDTVWLMSRDADFCPVVAMARERFGLKVVIVKPPDGSGQKVGGASHLEKTSGNRVFHVPRGKFAANQLPNPLVVGKKEYWRPPEWARD